MARLRVHGFTISLDGYAAGPNQRVGSPFGDAPEGLHEWMLATRTVRSARGEAGATTGIDDAEVDAGDDDVGATIMGRNMFGPVRGPWADWPGEPWNGWWGLEPPYHHDVFVLTHHARPPW